jgi:hypothetical protein
MMATPWVHRPFRAAAITLFELDRVAVLAGELVLVRWRTENAVTMRVMVPDGHYLDFDASSGAGAHQMVITRTGMVSAAAYGWAGPPATAGQPVAVFEIPRTTSVPVPDLGAVPMPIFGRTHVPALDRTGLAAALASRAPLSVTRTARVDRRVPPFAAPPVELLTIAAARSAERPAPNTGGWWSRVADRPFDLVGLFTMRRTGATR